MRGWKLGSAAEPPVLLIKALGGSFIRRLQGELTEFFSRLITRVLSEGGGDLIRRLCHLVVSLHPGLCMKAVRTKGGTTIPAELTLWAAGVKGPDYLADLDGLEVDRANRAYGEVLHDPRGKKR